MSSTTEPIERPEANAVEDSEEKSAPNLKRPRTDSIEASQLQYPPRSKKARIQIEAGTRDPKKSPVSAGFRIIAYPGELEALWKKPRAEEKAVQTEDDPKPAVTTRPRSPSKAQATVKPTVRIPPRLIKPIVIRPGLVRPRRPSIKATSPTTKPTSPTDTVTDATPSPNYGAAVNDLTGNFDLYAMSLEFLADIFTGKKRSEPFEPTGKGKGKKATNKSWKPKKRVAALPDYEGLYNEIILLQAEKDWTAQIQIPSTGVRLPGEPPSKPKETGKFSSIVLANPIDPQHPYEVKLYHVSLRAAGEFTFTEKQKKFFAEGAGLQSHDSLSPGIIAALKLAASSLSTDSSGGYEGVMSSSGYIKLRKVWDPDQPGDTPNEAKRTTRRQLFEGYAAFEILFSKHHPNHRTEEGRLLEFGFWAVRSAPIAKPPNQRR
ncbi:hypothetical protein CC1G_10391 [Coprinopsis cinerea okayama7|uniref:Uncharacterized protein n=1 Tax=Coprinopsis cinerea (strain Okayama-7 / 130 / ATCC MYA-4618 / FGSC 9003) TaxID=240176 RepID=A8PAL7_COPC7|nr:hypothetical protein CC1G_10391 [Coprinopsis cinerea okayama7\|eukprot:XP_001840007.1 hypothetical protein CC1G_10391 [Coprinopsis cinerea okayama7\